MTTYDHGIYGPVEITTEEAVYRLSRLVGYFDELCEAVTDWFDAEVDAGGYPLDEYGYRNLPSAVVTALCTRCEAEDAHRLIAAFAKANKGWPLERLAAEQSDGDGNG